MKAEMRRAPKLCLLLAPLLHLSPVRAQELTAGQHHVVMLAALLSVAERWCLHYRIDKNLVTELITEAGSTASVMHQRALFEADMRGMGERAYCDGLYQVLGPVPDGDSGDVPFMTKR